jgi:hypothetical protein
MLILIFLLLVLPSISRRLDVISHLIVGPEMFLARLVLAVTGHG